MHPNELVNILSSARADMRRHQERLAHLLAQHARGRVDLDARDAAEVERLFANILQELEEAITQRNILR